jgi:DNA topoisomerase-1
MGKKLVIVESPAKAKTISRFLGPEYVVEASVGHIRDLPLNKKGLPKELQKKWWADYAVDVDNGFEPFYEVPPEKQKYVDRLKKALKESDELVLATDEDREGESISWHLLQILKPKKGFPVKRIAFHEITKEAIQEALAKPRDIDEELVEAQEARRILDRLYGYTLSPVLWTKVAKDLSAGRVQSPAVKLIVDREKKRRDFVSSVYWDLKADVSAQGQTFTITLKEVDGKRIATGKDFDEQTGELSNAKAVLLDEQTAAELANLIRNHQPWSVSLVETNPGKESQPAPFRTTTLQQEANRKFGYSADRTMRIAQDLYEGVDIGGERVGLITYMRTDSLNLADSAIQQAREVIKDRFGDEHVPAKAQRYSSKVANAQEAHEAIRPTDFKRSPESIRRHLEALSDGHYKLYDLIYRRTLACQMRPAEVLRTQVEIEVEPADRSLTFAVSGKRITFPGFLLAYVEDVDDPEAEIEGKERLLPPLKVGETVQLKKLLEDRHETRPPARFTDASLIKELERLGIGRPSTYASIISVIVDRGYIRKKGRELIPTFTAFLTVELLDTNFHEFMDLEFTAKMDETLDQIANGKEDADRYLKRFFIGGDGAIGLKEAVETRKREIPFPNIVLGHDQESGKTVLVRLGRDGEPFIQLGDADDKKYANVPDDATPDEITLDKALELLNGKRQEAESIGIHPESGRRLLLKKRGNYYLEVERTPEEIEAKVKPTWVSLPQNVDPQTLTQEDLDALCRLPRSIGVFPDTGEEITFRLGKFGPYLQAGKEIRNIDDWRLGLSMDAAQATEIIRLPKGQAARASRAAAGPIQEFGELEGAAGPVRVLAGRFGPYVTDGTTNATLPKGMDPSAISAEQAIELIKAKAAAGPSPKRGRFKRTAAKAKKGRVKAKK